MPKTPPPKTLDALRPPNENHKYFENWQSNPFKHDAQGFEMVNAWWLAEAALLAYGDKGFVDKKFDSTGLTAGGFSVESFSNHNSQCFVAHNENFIIAAFRGTEIDNFWGSIMDVATDLKVIPVPDGAGGKIHHGFSEAISLIWKAFSDLLNSILSDGKSRALWLTGHSLGAAMATLAADRIIRVMNLAVNGIYTYGSPRVGNGDFVNRLAQEGLVAHTYRFVNNSDVIATVPLEGIYKHVGAMKLIDSNGLIQNVNDQSQIANNVAKFDLHKSVLKTFKSLSSLGGITKNVPDFLADHAPIYYPIHIWNNYERQP